MPEQWKELNQQAIDLMHRGDLEQAASRLQKTLDSARAEHGDCSESVAVTLNNMGELSHLAGEYDQAEKALRQSIEVSEEIHGKGSLEVGETQLNLAELYFLQQRDEEADRQVEEIVSIYEAKAGAEKSLLVSVYNTCATLYLEAGRV